MLFESKTHSGVANLFAIVLSFLSDWLTEFATPSLFGRMSMSLIQFGFWTHSGSMRHFGSGKCFSCAKNFEWMKLFLWATPSDSVSSSESLIRLALGTHSV